MAEGGREVLLDCFRSSGVMKLGGYGEYGPKIGIVKSGGQV
jgi:hypothetical protein